MSRVGKTPIAIPAGVKVSLKEGMILVSGPKGELKEKIPPSMEVKISDKLITVTRPSDERDHKALHGLTRALIANMVKGVVEGYEVVLEIVGVGYKAEIKGNTLNLSLGYTHPIIYTLPEGVKGTVEKNTKIILQSSNKQVLGQVAANIRKFRVPDAYKGKGIRYLNEYIKLKPGKTGVRA